MTDLEILGVEQLGYEIAQRAGEPGACDWWAHVRHDAAGPDRDPRLWPRDRGEPAGDGYRVAGYTACKGLLRITLLPSAQLAGRGIIVTTQLALLVAQHTRSVADLSPRQIDHVVQVGLFEEVLYR